MSRFLLFFSQVVILFLSARASSEVKKPTCRDNDGYNVCHYKGGLVEVTQSRFEDRLDLSDLDLLAIREDAFKNVSATHLYLNQGNRISVLKRESFRGLPNLERLHLDGNVVPLSGHLFAELGHLQSLSLIFNKIDSIPKDSFAGLSSLMWLYLGHNDIEAIEAESFSNVNPGLLYLWLNSNKISRVAPGSFAGLTELSRLHLDYNRLEELPSGAFRGLNKLEDLYLNDNRITSVSRSLFRDLVSLKRLYLQQNEISALEPGTFRELSQLELLRLDGNKLSHIVVGTFAGLSNLE
ncbi:leucine-rich repeat transmembrane neuronal protein 4-like, partial [Temnothorax curvispinosus]|uniref:Leucine-rich repeat transmembrane neuronal protein 4-like n=1 Tax=Temnothorax curvispinosus TaxID=300111 RepID=A0A6J1RFX9_9HYME